MTSGTFLITLTCVGKFSNGSSRRFAQGNIVRRGIVKTVRKGTR